MQTRMAQYSLDSFMLLVHKAHAESTAAIVDRSILLSF